MSQSLRERLLSSEFEFYQLPMHSSEIRGLRSTKRSSKMLQNLLYFMYKKTHIGFSFHATLHFYLMNAPVYVDIDQGIHKGKIARNEKRKKLHGLSYT